MPLAVDSLVLFVGCVLFLQWERKSVWQSVSTERFVILCLANSQSIYIHLRLTSGFWSINLKNVGCSTECRSLITSTKLIWLTSKCHKIYLSGPFGFSVLRHPNHLVLHYLPIPSLGSRRLEVVGERENGRARGRHAPIFPCAHYFQGPCYAGKPIPRQGHPTTECFHARPKCLKLFSLCFGSLFG